MEVINPLTPRGAAQALSTIEESFKVLDSQIRRAAGDLHAEVIARKNVEAMLENQIADHQQTLTDLDGEQRAHTQTKDKLSQEEQAHTETRTALSQEQQGHAQTRNARAEEQEAHAQTKRALAEEQKGLAETKDALAQEQQAHRQTQNALGEEQQGHARTQDALSQQEQSHARTRAAHNAEVNSHGQTRAALAAEQAAHGQTQAQYNLVLERSRQQLAEALQIVARTFPARNGEAVLELNLAEGILSWSQPTNISPQIARDHQLTLPPHSKARISVKLPDGTDGEIIKLMELVALAKDFAAAQRLDSDPLSQKVAGAILRAGSLLHLQYLYGNRANLMLDRCAQDARIRGLVLEQSSFTASGEFRLSGCRAKDCLTVINHPKVEFKDTRIKGGSLDGFMADAVIDENSYIQTDFRSADLERADWKARGATAAQQEADLRVRHAGSVVPIERTSPSLLRVIKELRSPEVERIDELRNQVMSGGALINTFSSAFCMKPHIFQATAASDPLLFGHPELALQHCNSARVARLALPSGMNLLVVVPDDEQLNPIVFDITGVSYQSMSTVFRSKDRQSIWLAAARVYINRPLRFLKDQQLGAVGVP